MSINQNSIAIGEVSMGNRRGEPFLLDLEQIKRHLVAIGGSGSGKTWALKVVCEGLAARGIPILAVCAMGDITGLALPTGCPGDYEGLGLRPPDTSRISPDEWEAGAAVAEVLRERVVARVLTPCSNSGEKVAIQPLTSRPRGWDKLADEDRMLQADAQAIQFLTRLGIRVRATGGAPCHVLGVTTEALMRCWDADGLEDGPGLFQQFGQTLLDSTEPALLPTDKGKIAPALQAASLGVSRLWYEGQSLDLDRLLAAPKGKTAIGIIYINHINVQDRPWVIGQIAHAALNWCIERGGSPERPRLALLVDELAGDGGQNKILPPGTVTNHPSGEALRRILRQGRHYGCTLLAGSQSAGDIDYKSFSNFGTRIVGRLANRSDVEKCVYGLSMGKAGEEKLEKFIVSSPPGNLFVIPPNAEWERVKLRMLGCAHSTITKPDLERLYQRGVLRRMSPMLKANDGDQRERWAKQLEAIIASGGEVMPAGVAAHLQAALQGLRGAPRAAAG